MADKALGGIADHLGPMPGLHNADHHHIDLQRGDVGLDHAQGRAFAEMPVRMGNAMCIGQRIERIVIIEAGAGSFLINIKAPIRHLAPGSAERCSIAMDGVKGTECFARH